jgi:molybdate transport system permease protein
MVLPPTVCGFLLLLLLGRNTALGQWFIDIGFPLIFSWPATVIAATVVAFPLMYRSSRGAFENLDPNMLDAARTLGWSNARIFFRLMIPLSWSSIAAATVLAFARALGEFGATLFLAGNYVGITRTIPIAIYFEWMSGNLDVAIFWTVVILIFSFLVILFINLWSRHTTKYRRGADE